MPFKNNNTAAAKEDKKESYIMVRVTSSFKARAVKAAGGGKLSSYVTNLIEKDLKENGIIHQTNMA